LEFEWKPDKENDNLKKHGVDFVEAATVFADTLSVTVSDPDHSENEGRFIIAGYSNRHRPLIVSYTDRGRRIRIISARELTPAERHDYEEETHK
jgi:uncharacterized DUF497 family protein